MTDIFTYFSDSYLSHSILPMCAGSFFYYSIANKHPSCRDEFNRGTGGN